VYNSNALSKVKYILGAGVLTGAIASRFCEADPVGPLLLLATLLGGVISAVVAAIMRKWSELTPVLLCSFLSFVFFPELIDRCRSISNDDAAISNLRTIATAELTYQSTATRYGGIEDLIASRLIDERYSGVAAGYRYSVTMSPNGLSFVAMATRESTETGRYDYYCKMME
jgi:hypothetical protein